MIPFLLFSIVLLAIYAGYSILKNKVILKTAIIFSGSFLLAITLLEIFAKHIFISTNKQLAFWVLFGVFIQLVLESMTKGIEHGHAHKNQKEFNLLFVGLIIHAFLEGLPGEMAGKNYIIAILVHKVPIALVFGALLKASFYSKKRILFLALIFALATPIGLLLGTTFVHEHSDYFMAIAGGIFLHISTTIIFESSENHKLKLSRLVAIGIGFLIACFITY